MDGFVVIIVTIILYLVMMVVIGVIFSRKNNDVGDFYLGGRKLGPLVTAMSAEASDMSSWLLMGLPGLAYLCGCADAGWTAIGLAVGTYLNWLIVAKRLRVYSHRLGAITIPDFFSKRYGDDKNILTGIAAVIILIFFIPYTASGFSACGTLFKSLFGWDYHLAMLISAAIIILYTSIGGFLAASTTDLIQSIVMTTALVIVVIFGINSAGGINNVVDNSKNLNGYFTLFENHITTEDMTYEKAVEENLTDDILNTYEKTEDGKTEEWVTIKVNKSNSFDFLSIISTVAWGLGYFGMPHILLRFMAAKDKTKIKTSRRIASIWVVISMGVAIFIGIISRTISAQSPETLPLLANSSDSETAVIKIAFLMGDSGFMMAIFAGLIFAGILACTMSTADSQLLAASSSASENIMKGLFKIKLSDKASMLVARITLAVIAVIAVLIAWDENSSIFMIVSFAWGGFGATFGPVMLLALLWKRSNKWGAIAGMGLGGVMIFVWKFVVRPLGGAFDIYELLPAFIVALVADIVVSLATGGADQKTVEVFDAVKADLHKEEPVTVSEKQI